jgi:ERCC4-type nuclease
MITVDTNAAETALFQRMSAVDTGRTVLQRRRLDLGDVELRSHTADAAEEQGVAPRIIVVERKTLSDFAASFGDGRYKQQKGRMLHACDLAQPIQFVYLIESESAPLSWDGTTGGVKNRAMHAAMIKMQLRDGLCVVHSRGGQESVNILLYMHEELVQGRLNAEAPRASAPTIGVASRKRANLGSGRSMYVAMLTAIPGVSESISTAIVDAYPTMERLNGTDMDTLAKTPLETAKRTAGLPKRPATGGTDSVRAPKVRRVGPVVAKRVLLALGGVA